MSFGHLAQQRVGDHQRRRGQVVRAHVGVHAALEVAVAGDHRGADQPVVLDRIDDRVVQRAGVADAGGAAIAHRFEADRIEVLGQAGLVEIFGDHLRAGRERGLHPRLRLQPLGVRLARHQAGGDQHRRVRRVGAGGDRRDHHVAVGQFVVLALDLDRGPGLVGRHAEALGQIGLEGGRNVLQQHAVLRPLRAGHRRLHRGQVQFQRVGEHRVGRAGLAEHALRLQVRLHQRDAVRRRGRTGAGSRARPCRPGRSRRWRHIPAPCCRSWRDPAGRVHPGRGRRIRRICRRRPCGAASA